MASKNSFTNFYNKSPSATVRNNNIMNSTNPDFTVDYDGNVLSKSYSTGFLSRIEQEILRSNSPINFSEDNIEEVTINGEKGK